MSEKAESKPGVAIPIQRWVDGQIQATEDWVAEEAPLQIRVEGHDLAVVMRTPGRDRELVAGFLLTEGIIKDPTEVFEISTCPSSQETGGHVVDVVLTDPRAFQPEKMVRHVFTSSSCGVCGKASVQAVLGTAPQPMAQSWQGSEEALLDLLASLPERQRAAQPTFASTGGLHASALFSFSGELLAIQEDVGRHNALDKIIGQYVLSPGKWPLPPCILLLSGRISFELMQKAYAAKMPIVAGIGAPSSLAVDFAKASGQRLVGFLRERRANIYSAGH